LGTRLAARLITAFGHPRAVFRAAPGELEAQGLAPLVARTLGQGPVFEEAAKELEKVRQAGAELIVFSDPRYPEILRQIFDPPVVLYAKGNAELLAAPCLAVVGARKPTPYGLAVAERLATDLATRGLVIVSGMARGIDTAAHRGAMAGGKTIAVLGCGIDLCYPSENKRLKAQIEKDGLVISEFPMGGFAAPQNFPIRNRVISGLSLGALVVEAAQYSGSLITARMAMEQDREVFCVPGNIANKFSWGPNTLIKQGAKLVQDWKDVIEELPATVRQRLPAPPENDSSGAPQASLFTEGLGPVEKNVEALLRVDQALQIDELLSAVPQHSPSEVLAALLELEIKGRARQLPGKHYVKVL
jgi:DNA processing protein